MFAPRAFLHACHSLQKTAEKLSKPQAVQVSVTTSDGVVKAKDRVYAEHLGLERVHSGAHYQSILTSLRAIAACFDNTPFSLAFVKVYGPP